MNKHNNQQGRDDLQSEQLHDQALDHGAVLALDLAHTVPLLSVLVDRADITGSDDLDLHEGHREPRRKQPVAFHDFISDV
jgi:hypothetical protein